MLRVFILAVLATGASAPFAGVFDDLDARVNQGLHDAVDNLQEGGLPAAVADLAHSFIPDNPAPASSDPIRGEDDEADEADEADEDEAEEDNENGVCDEANESCGVEEDPGDVEYAEYEEAEEHEEFDEEEFFENEYGGDEEEEEGDDSGDGTNGDGEYDPRSEREQLNDPKFDHDRFKWIGPKHGATNFKFNLIERTPYPPYKNHLIVTDKLLYCKSNGTTNKKVAFNIAADQGQKLRTEVTHRYSIGVAAGRGSKHWPRAQTHGETTTSLNLKLGVKRVFDERINLAEGWSSYPFDVRILGLYMDFGVIEQDLESLELRPGPILKCVWATGLKSYTLADDVGFSMDVSLAGGRSNTGNNIMKCWAGVDRMKNVLVFTGWPWAREEFGLVKPQVALRQFHAFDEFKSPSPVWKPVTSNPFTHRLLHPQVIPHR